MPVAILKDFLVAECATGIAGQYLGKLLADAGAHVIKLEPPEGNPLRRWPRQASTQQVEESKEARETEGTGGAGDNPQVLFEYLNTSKGSLVVDLHAVLADSTAPLDAAPLDAAPLDTGPPDAGPPDAGPPDFSHARSCDITHQLLAEADILIEDTLELTQLEQLRQQNPKLVVTSISPYGKLSPEARTPATEFTLQARAGGLGKRGRLERPPVQAGGHIGEWMAGVCGAVGTLAAALRERNPENKNLASNTTSDTTSNTASKTINNTTANTGEHVDVSIFEGLVIATNIYSFLLASLSDTWDVPLPNRNLEMPSIEPTADGFVGFSTMAQQQFQDFLVMVGAHDWVGDPSMANPAKRWERRDEFFELVHRWTKARTTDEIIAIATDLRIPVSPISNGATIPDLEVFEGRDMFVRNPSGGFIQPRRPYVMHGVKMPEIGPAPELGCTSEQDVAQILQARKTQQQTQQQTQQNDNADASAFPQPTHTQTTHPQPAPPQPAHLQPAHPQPTHSPRSTLPLEGVRIIECTGWWAGPIAGQTLAMLGADIIKVESIQHPDGMRFASVKPPTQDQWWEWGMVFHGVNTNKRGITLNLSDPKGKKALEKLASNADVLIENFTPRVMDNFGITWESLSALNPNLIMVRMPGFGLSGPWRNNTGFAQTMEQMSGLAYLTGYPQEPPQIPRGPCDPIAGLHASFAVLLALEERRQSGKGKLVEVAMIEAALNAAAEPIIEHSANGFLMERDGNSTPGFAPQGVYPCQDTETWVAISVQTDAQWDALAQVAGKPDWSADKNLRTWQQRYLARDRLDEAISAWSRKRQPDVAAKELLEAGVPACEVMLDRHVGLDQLLWDRGFFVELTHPVAGKHGYPSVPFKYADLSNPWVKSAPPLVGEHNLEVLKELGYSTAEVQELRADEVVGDRPLGLG